MKFRLVNQSRIAVTQFSFCSSILLFLPQAAYSSLPDEKNDRLSNVSNIRKSTVEDLEKLTRRIEALESTTQLTSSNDKAKRELARLHYRLSASVSRNEVDSLMDLYHACYLDPAEPAFYVRLNDMLKKKGVDPGSFEQRVESGNKHFQRGQFTAAIVDYREAIRIKPDPAIREKLGDVYRFLHEDDQALWQYLLTAEVKDSGLLERKIGNSFAKLGEYDKSKEALFKAEQLGEPDMLDQMPKRSH